MDKVVWIPEALNDLADVWRKAKDRSLVTQAVQNVDRRLSRNPADEGESRDRGRRILFEHRLGILFRVDEDTGNAIVLAAWSIERTGRKP